jgi:hypothetical protein
LHISIDLCVRDLAVVFDFIQNVALQFLELNTLYVLRVTYLLILAYHNCVLRLTHVAWTHILGHKQGRWILSGNNGHTPSSNQFIGD